MSKSRASINLAPLLMVLSLVAGAAAIFLTPREEEPQIVVPMADVLVSAPGLSAQEVERQIATLLENLLFQIDDVPFFALLFAWYQRLATRPNSAIINQEKLYREPKFAIYVIFLSVLVMNFCRYSYSQAVDGPHGDLRYTS